MGYSEQRIPRPNAGTPRGMGDYDAPDIEFDMVQCLRCENRGPEPYAVRREGGYVCNRCDEEEEERHGGD